MPYAVLLTNLRKMPTVTCVLYAVLANVRKMPGGFYARSLPCQCFAFQRNAVQCLAIRFHCTMKKRVQ